MSDLAQTSCACAPILVHMHEKFELNQTKIKGVCQSGTKVAAHDFKSDLSPVSQKSILKIIWIKYFVEDDEHECRDDCIVQEPA